MALVHGGNVYETAFRLGCSPDAILDYSASINPLGPPPGLAEEFSACFHRLQHYPDIGNTTLIDALSDFHGISKSRIVVGNGSTELIYWLPRVLGIKKAVVALPTFSEYRKAFELHNAELHNIITSSGAHYQPTVEQMEAVFGRVSPDAILFTNPGSPSGTLLQTYVRQWLLEKSHQDGIFSIVDEVFVDFCEEESLKRHLDESPNLVLIRSMTKFYGVPGLRLGYILTSESIAARMKNAIPPWSVNTLAQIAGAYCLKQKEYRKRTLEVIQQEREKMLGKLALLDGCRVFPGQANYLLIEFDNQFPPADVLQQELLSSERILIRDCRSFEGLGDHHVRVAIRLPEQNERLINGIIRWHSSHSCQTKHLSV
ncbi:MAG: pyridoxal phosphate-dependent aminotransferase [Syntrophobacteraceae bacterium]